MSLILPLFSALFALSSLLLPRAAMAFSLDSNSIMVLCGVMPCPQGGGGAAGLSVYIYDHIVEALEIGVIAAAVISLFISAVQMVMFSNDETTVKDSRTSYIYIISGLVVVGLAHLGVMAFSAPNAGTDLVNVPIVESSVNNVILYFRLIIAITLMVNIVLQAVRLIASQGQQEQADKAKNRLIAGFIGAAIILLANALVMAALPGFGGSTIVAQEIAGIANYLLTILGFIALLAIVVAGILLIISVDESLKEKAKTIVKTSIIALIIVLLSYVFVTGFINLS